MATGADAARITAKVRGKDITLDGPLTKDEIRSRIWWWLSAEPEASEEGEDTRREHDGAGKDVIMTLGGYYEVSPDPHTPEAQNLVEMVHDELNPDG
ncbi:hypothetical protein GCM10018980_17550 [Streptomyces capoamus]|uniref:Uncharacterized protein n=1 Tax=Streptomyces capoamus TaxID=68183 RepID=A0A919C3N0_9ACTN|nr:hypothetical protein [Streptomyces capoamus]GGW16143.1 hypothetical protein GCM10010501_31170 [Streptomyces libani subsp. rufus]GHG42128.1 hypothetical protein GCM10018980_17550 [Streptomyces capoamus]